MKATVEQLLLVGLVVAFGLGYLAGSLKTSSGPLVIQPGAAQVAPNNYDPARAICSDALKTAQDSEQRCWGHLQAELERRTQQKAVGH